MALCIYYEGKRSIDASKITRTSSSSHIFNRNVIFDLINYSLESPDSYVQDAAFAEKTIQTAF